MFLIDPFDCSQYFVILHMFHFLLHLNETPLHFACKFGHIEMVQWLCAQPQTDKRRQNKYQQTPQDVTCQRVRSGADRARAAIEACLQGGAF